MARQLRLEYEGALYQVTARAGLDRGVPPDSKTVLIRPRRREIEEPSEETILGALRQATRSPSRSEADRWGAVGSP